MIWRDLKLDRLRGRNLQVGDFFDSATFVDQSEINWPLKFDVVIGNPPFESRLTPAAKAIDEIRSKNRPKLPDKQVAYLFLEQGLMSLAPGGALCLIQPHGLLYNSRPVGFRQYLMRQCRLSSILDFVSMRGLYDGADPKTVAWHAVNEPIVDQLVRHLIFRRTYSASERLAFEIDHYDWQVVSQYQALSNPFVWRIGLLGGGRLHDISDRVTKMPALKGAIALKGWVYFEGFNVGRDGNPCEYLTGQPYLPTKGLSENGIDENLIEPLGETTFVYSGVKELYEPPLILVRENASLPAAFWNKSRLTYRHSIVGIHAPAHEEGELHDFFVHIKKHRRVYRFCFLLNGVRALTGRSTAINKQDIDRLPYPEDPSELDFAFWEDVLKEDVLNYTAEYVRLGQDSRLLKNEAKSTDLREYSSLYVRMLGSLYRNLKVHEPIFLNGLIAQPFYFGARPDVSWLDADCKESLHQLIYDNSGGSLRTVRVVRYYDSNVILIVKPNRSALILDRSTAIRDADDTLVDLREQGW